MRDTSCTMPGAFAQKTHKNKKKCLEVYGTVKDVENTVLRTNINKSDVTAQVSKALFITYNGMISPRFARLSNNA